MKLSKILKIFSIVMVFAFVFSACSSADQSADSAAEAPAAADEAAADASSDDEADASEEEKVVLTISNWQFNEAGKSDQLRTLMATYQETHPNVEFEEISTPWGEYEDSLYTRWAAGDGPDILFFVDATLPRAVDEGHLAVLDELIDFSQYSDQFSSIMDIPTINDNIYAFVSEAVVQELIYNVDLFEQAGFDPNTPPTTVDEFIEVCNAINDLGADYKGYGVRNSMDQSFGWFADYGSWAYGFGAKWAVDGVPTINSPENVQALSEFKRVYETGCMTQGVSSTNYRKAMGLGQQGFLTDNSSLVNVYRLDSPDMNVGTAALPFPSPNAVAEVVFIGISEDSENKAEAAKFIEWFMQPDVYKPWMEEIWCPTGAYAQSVSQEWLDANPNAAPFVKGAETAFSIVPEGLGVYMGQFRDIVLYHMETVLLADVDSPSTYKPVFIGADLI